MIYLQKQRTLNAIGMALLLAIAACGKSTPAGQLDWKAIENGDLTSIESFLNAGGDAESKHSGPTAWRLMHFAARWGNTKVLEALLAKGARIDTTTTDGWTPLFYAALNGHAGSVRFLLSKGANANAKAQDGSTPLSLADGAEVEEILKGAGARAE